MDNFDSTITITLGDVAENHVGNARIGKLASAGLTLENLVAIGNWWREQGKSPELVRIGSIGDAYVLFVPGAIEGDAMYRELRRLDWDKKFLSYGQVRNKHARHNLCFGDFSREPVYEEGKGRVYDLAELPELTAARDLLVASGFLSKEIIVAEGNLYYSDKCYIGWHGDAERKNTAAIRLGKPMYMQWRWHQGKEVIPGESYHRLLNHGDVYYMSSKATGHDWRLRKIPTVRHRAGYTLE